MAFFIETVPEAEAESLLKEQYEANLKSLGYIANYTRAFSLRPEVMRAWQGLIKAISANMDPHHYELATVAAATALRSSYCSLAHGKALKQFYDDAEITDLARDTNGALEPADAALMAFARKVALEAHQITQADIDALRGRGFSDASILDIALAAAARCFFSKTIDAVGAQPDSAYRQLGPELREALTVGRPISQD